MINSEEKKLNKEQKEAVQHREGPLLIIAGAGTGKTTVVTERIKWLISQGLAKPSEILALTFTDKAAREMEGRVDLALPYGYTDMWISTFHSFCDRVLRNEAVHIGLDPGYHLMTQAETIQFITRNLFEFELSYFRPLGNPTKFVSGLLQHFSRLKDEDVLPSEYLHWAQSQAPKAEKEEAEKYLELARAYQTYEELKIKEGVMDFGDLISHTLRLFRERAGPLREYQEKFKYILVDEFQDTNYAQNQLAMLLAGKKANITCTADDDQSIYRFRGAAVSNVVQFKQNYPRAKIVVLSKNYRSTQTILDYAYKLIQSNNPDRLEVKENINKKLKAVRRIRGEPIEFIFADRVEDEAEAVAKTIRGLTDGSIGNYDFKNIAILVRANNHADSFVRALSRAGVPYQFLGPGQLFRQPEVKDLIAYLKVLYNPEDNVALYRVLSMDLFDLSARDLAFLNSLSRKFNLSFFEICEVVAGKRENRNLFKQETTVALKERISEKTRERVKDFVAMVHRHFKLLPKETAGQILYYFLEDTGLLKKLAEYKTPLEEKKAQNISRFFDKLKTYEVDHEDASVAAVVDWINLSMELGESPLASDIDWIEENRVNILTVHSAKGLEFPVVFLVNLVAARFPTRERREQIPIPDPLIKEILPAGDYHEQEERRLFYVGMTRACDRLFLTAANYYGEGKREKKLSPFVVEALGEKEIKRVMSKKLREKELQQLSILDWQKPKEEKPPVAQLPSCPITYLSFSQIATFDTCPLQYRYRYIQRIPVPPSAAQSFGDSIHKTLRDFCQKIKEGQRLTLKELTGLLENNWSSEGYASKAHEKRMKKQGKQMLANFYKSFDFRAVPKDLERSFVVRVGQNLKIGGKIDRVDEQKNRLEIIDYKTGRVLEQKDIDNSLQMTVYALAATDKGIYNRKPEEVVLSFYFLDTGEKKSTKRDQKQLEEAKKKLVEKAREIEKSSFEPRPGQMCDFCEYKLLCEAWV